MKSVSLENINPHEKDKHISLNESDHIYTIDNDSNYTSVTTWVHSHFEKFNADIIIKKMKNSKKWRNNKYYGLTDDEIKKLWKNNGIDAANKGTKLHNDIESFYNKININNNSIEYKYFLKFNKDHIDKVPYRTEWKIWDRNLKLAGSIDMTFINKDNTIDIYDWKRCTNIKIDNKWQSAKTKIISHIPDCNFWHYSLQLNMYKYILESNYNKNISNMYLVCLHPNNKNNSYIKIKVQNLQKDIINLINY